MGTARDKHVVIPVGISAATVAPAVAACTQATLAGETMGTCWSVKYLASAKMARAVVEQALAAEFQRTIDIFSNWVPASFVSRFNRASAGSWHVMPLQFEAVLTAALGIARQSAGAFNPCLGARVPGLNFGAGPAVRTSLAGAEEHDWQDIEFDGDLAQLYQPGGLMLDLSAIAKGHAVDRAAQVLDGLGLNSYLMEIGGEFVGRGVKEDGTPWWVAVDSDQGEPFVAALCDLAVATSGEGHRHHEGRGAVEGHLVRNPNAAPLENVSVFHTNCMMADGWATALHAMGPESGLHLANRLGLAALFRLPRGGWRASEALKAMLE